MPDGSCEGMEAGSRIEMGRRLSLTRMLWHIYRCSRPSASCHTHRALSCSTQILRKMHPFDQRIYGCVSHKNLFSTSERCTC